MDVTRGSKYPVMKAADLAGEAEDAAKNYRYPLSADQPVREKNAITFLNKPLAWDVEYQAVKVLKDELCSLYLSEDKMPHSLLSKIAGHFEMADIKNGAITNPKTYWMLAYDLGRMKQRIKEASITNWINLCVKDIHQNTIKGSKVQTDYHSLANVYSNSYALTPKCL